MPAARHLAAVLLPLTLALAACGGGGRDGHSAMRHDAAAAANAYRGSEPPAQLPIPSFALRDYTGTVVRSSDLRGKVALITFLDSQCTDSCPVIARQLALAVDALGMRERRQVVAVAISTDPAEDTPRSIRRFLARQRALGKFRYLDGAAGEMARLWKQFGILSSHESGHDTLHSSPVRIYDARGRWVATQHPGADLTPANLAHDVRVALKASARRS